MYSKRFLMLVLIVFVVALVLTSILTILPSTKPKIVIKKIPSKYKDPTKKILYWNTFFNLQNFGFGEGTAPFLKSCSEINCYITGDKSIMPEEYFDAVIFHGPEFNEYSKMPQKRYSNQRYVYFSMESPLNRPVSKFFDGFYNWTMTYRTDSDIPIQYFKFNVVNSTSVNDNREYEKLFQRKTKPIAWFVSNCQSRNKRENYVNELKKHIDVDIYGACGNLTCHKGDEICGKLLEQNYYFYLAFENSNCVDYLTEKAITAYKNNVIPIIYSGVNLSKFLPPNSYLDASVRTPYELAIELKKIMKDYAKYVEYFRWKYSYKIGYSESAFCELCSKLNSESEQQTKVYDLNKWWHGENNEMCVL